MVESERLRRRRRTGAEIADINCVSPATVSRTRDPTAAHHGKAARFIRTLGQHEWADARPFHTSAERIRMLALAAPTTTNIGDTPPSTATDS